MQRYENYKVSGVDWIGEIPEDWKFTAVKNLLAIPITDGPHTTPILYDEGVPFISAEAVKNNRLDFSKKRGFISQKDHSEFSKKYRPKRDDIYMVKSGATTGNIAIVETDIDFSIWSPLAVFRVNYRLEPKFLFFALQSVYFKKSVELKWSFGTQQNIGMGVLSNLPIVYPQKEEQQTIATFLDDKTAKIDQTIANKQKEIELLKERRQILIQKAVTKGLDDTVKLKDSGVDWIGDIPEHWDFVRLKMLSKIYSGGTPDKTNLKFWENGTIPWIASGEVNQEFVKIPTTFISEKGFRNSSAKWIRKNSLVVALAGQGKTKGMVAYLDIDTTGNQSLAAVIPGKNYVFPLYLFYFIKSAYKELRGTAGEGERDGLNLSKLGNLFVSFPNISEQKEICIFLKTSDEKISKAILLKQQEIEKLKEYKTVLIDNVVTGKVRVS